VETMSPGERNRATVIKYVALWKLPEGVTEEQFEEVYGRHVREAARRMPGLLRYTISRVEHLDPVAEPYYRLAELYFSDVDSYRESMAYITALPEDDDLNPSSTRKLSSSTLRLICDEEIVVDRVARRE
jgi:hypothetical protein